MKPVLATIAFVLALALAPVPAAAEGAASMEAARAAQAEGRFLEAAELGAAVGMSEGYALAADCLAIHGRYAVEGKKAKKPVFERAMRAAEEAVRLDPENAEAWLQSAHAMGRFSRSIGTFQAIEEGYAERIRDALKAVLRLDPDNAGGHLSFGAWHAEIASHGFAARLLYGGSEEKALAHFERALELAPEVKAVSLEYAVGLLALDEDDNRDKARALLRSALALPARNAQDRLVHGDVEQALKALDSGD